MIAVIERAEVHSLAILPMVSCVLTALLVVIFRSFLRRQRAIMSVVITVALFGLALTGFTLVLGWQDSYSDGVYVTLSETIIIDRFGIFLGLIIVGATTLSLLLTIGRLMSNIGSGPEYVALVLLAASGMLAMVSANDLVVMFVALEVFSIPLYVLTSFERRHLQSQEAGLKYFLLGAFSSAIFLYGIALLYGATGSTSLSEIASFLSQRVLLERGSLVLGVLMVIVGLAFKVGAVPFHQWVPDAYEGAPTPVTAFMGAATKVAAFGALARVLGSALGSLTDDWQPLLLAAGVASLVVGPIAALRQADIKRALAYSSIAHAGYMLMAVHANSGEGTGALLAYLAIYGAMALGAFGVVGMLAGNSDNAVSVTELTGLAKRRPVLASMLSFFLLAQAGTPFTGGFVAKFSVFAASVEQEHYAFVIVGVIAAVVSAAMYLRFVLVMYAGDVVDLTDRGPEVADLEPTPPGDTKLLTQQRRRLQLDQQLWNQDEFSVLAIGACFAFVVFTGIYPQWLAHLANNAPLPF